MKRSLILIMLAVLIAACSTHKYVYQPQEIDPAPVYLPFEAPNWLWQIPSGSYAIGFAFKDTHLSNRADSIAKEYAAVSLSRNHSSFIVDKKALSEWASQTQSDWKAVELQFVVSSDLDYLKKSHSKLQLVDSYEHDGYLIGLYGFIDGKVNPEIQVMQNSQTPDWCVDEATRQQGNVVYYTASALAATLPEAWNLAHEKALRLIGKYRLQKVKGAFEERMDMTQRRLAIETVSESYKAYFVKSFIVPISIEGQKSYRVYLQIKSSE